MSSPQYVEIKFPSDMFYIAPLRAFASKLAQRLGFQPLRVEDIELVLDEVCNNAVEHGSPHPQAWIIVQFTVEKDFLHILVRDSGSCKSEHWLETRRLDEVRHAMRPEAERGHGIFLMQTLADQVEFCINKQGGTDVHLVFRLPSDTMFPLQEDAPRS